MAEAYEVPGWPSAVLGHSAVTPGLTRLAGSGAMQYKDGLTGHPGTQQIPTGKPQTPSPDVGDLALAGTSRSSDAPGNWFLPNLYYARPERAFWPGAGQPVSVRSDNLMPVPATDPRGVPARLAVPAVQRGRFQIQQPPQLVSWPNRGGG